MMWEINDLYSDESPTENKSNHYDVSRLLFADEWLHAIKHNPHTPTFVERVLQVPDTLVELDVSF